LGEPAEDIAEQLSDVEEAFLGRLRELEPFLPFRVEVKAEQAALGNVGTRRWLEAWHGLSPKDRLLALRLVMNSTRSVPTAGEELLKRDHEAAEFAERLRLHIAEGGGEALDVDVWWESYEDGFVLSHRDVSTPLGFKLSMAEAASTITDGEDQGTESGWRGPWWFAALGMPRWRRLIEREFMAAKGVYRIIAVDPFGSPLAIPRACGVDPTGTLYIGTVEREDSRLIARLDKAHECFEREEAWGRWSHAGAWNLVTYGVLDGLDIRHGLRPTGVNHLRFAWISAPGWSHIDSMREEAEHLLAYGAVFGDLPPGNMNAGTLKHLTRPRKAIIDEARGRSPASWYVRRT
jgi:hypothetical protein